MKKQNLAYLLAILTVALWSTVASAFKISLRYLNFYELLFFSSFFSLVLLFIILNIQGKFKLVLQSSSREILHSIAMGFLNPFFYYLILFKSYSILPAQEAITLNYTWPIMLVLLSIPILKQKISIISIVSIFISFIGAVIIANKGSLANLQFSNLAADFLPVFSAVIWALFWIFNIKDKRDKVVKLFLNFLFGFIFMLIFSIFYKIDVLQIVAHNWEGIIGSAYVGFFEMGVTFVIWLKALQLSETTAKISNFIYITPFLSLVVVNIVIGEEILLATFIGLIFIISGIALQKYSDSRILKTKNNDIK
ncbi:MAG: DMT family transporter [Candidatus Cloacimonetes bacterium]|nr:DMT family transporter [Candidatus Cloacimonadota bacterium]